MFIEVSKVQELIEAAEWMTKNLPAAEQYIHASEIAATLNKLVDDETAHLDKMAEEFEAQQVYEEDEAAIAANEMMESASAVMDWAQQEKLMDNETRQIQDWPGAL